MVIYGKINFNIYVRYVKIYIYLLVGQKLKT
jgi:hypothetical protein